MTEEQIKQLYLFKPENKLTEEITGVKLSNIEKITN